MLSVFIVVQVSTMQDQLKSKGGYDVRLPVQVQLSLINVQR